MFPLSTSDRSIVLALVIQLMSVSACHGATPTSIAENDLLQSKTKQSTGVVSRIESENHEFMDHYVSLPPQERVEIWSHADANIKYLRSTVEWRMQSEMEQALIVGGVDAVPYLSKVLLAGSTGRRLRVLKILCDMDRFVPDEEIPLDAARDFIYVGALRQGGRVNPFIPVDGHRIGKEGLDAVLSAAHQTENKLVQFYTRLFTGQVRRELENLSLEEQIRRWREAVVKSQIVVREKEYPESSATYRLLEVILMERMPESIPQLTELLERDKNPYVREELIHVFAQADLCSVRLRKLESGRLVIDAVRRALEHGSFALGYKKEQQRKEGLNLLLGQFMKDEVRFDALSQWALYGQALESLHGDKTMVDYNPQWIRRARPEVRSFVSYLTEKDPYFPRWEYMHCDGSAADEVTHLRFGARIERLHSEWQLFTEQNQGDSKLPSSER